VNISIAVRTTIIGLLYFSPYLCNILHLQRRQAKVVSDVLLILLCSSLKNESLRSFRKKICGASTLKPLRSWLASSGRVYPPWTLRLLHGPLPISQNLDPPLVIVIMYFQMKVRKKFIGDILHIVIIDFSADILTLSVKLWCPGLVQEKLWSACTILVFSVKLSTYLYSGYTRLGVGKARNGVKVMNHDKHVHFIWLKLYGVHFCLLWFVLNFSLNSLYKCN